MVGSRRKKWLETEEGREGRTNIGEKQNFEVYICTSPSLVLLQVFLDMEQSKTFRIGNTGGAADGNIRSGYFIISYCLLTARHRKMRGQLAS
jgi:hypothetical protein